MLKEMANECVEICIYAHVEGLKGVPDSEESVGESSDVCN